MRFVSFAEVADTMRGKTVAVVGSSPCVLDNEPGLIDSRDVVVRVNNHKTGPQQGYRTDVHYSFYGASIRKSADELKAEGVRLCMCKCPNSKPLDSQWHERNNRLNGIDFRYIYALRKDWWFIDTYVPDDASFMQKFNLLGGHIPSTGFAAILDVLACEPAATYLTGFDFFRSGFHNINERWRAGNPADPIGHRPELELQWIAANRERYPLALDAQLESMIDARAAA